MKLFCRDLCCGVRYLRAKCFFIGYLNMIASIVDLGCHLVILSAVTNFFSCDVDLKILHHINWTWLEPFLVIINIGTHGFYPFPLVLGYYSSLATPGPRCYPGMIHVYLIDVINILIHVVWLRLVLCFIAALRKKDADTMRMFFSLSVIKIVLQILYFTYTPFQVTMFSKALLDSYWAIKILDICVAISFVCVLNSYIKTVRLEKAQTTPEVEQPPSYVECLMRGSAAQDQSMTVMKEKQDDLPLP